MTRAAIVAALFATILLPAAVAATRAQYRMGTVCEIDADVPADAAFEECSRIEEVLSTWREESELSRVNRGATPSFELAELLATTERYSRETDGAFQPRIRALLNKWGIRKDVAQTLLSVPDRQECLSHTSDYEEGGFAKGYAIDRMLEALKAEGATRAVINFGGQIGTLGSTEVTIADPKHRDRAIVALTLRQRSLSTSSTSEKPNHIIDPRSGQPVPARGSVSVISDSALEADILSTALYVMGRERGLEWARAHRITAIYIDNGSIEASAPIPGIRVLDAHFKLKD
jgi:thiamine biosynthesis lipoprotein